jgi:hypothetical protein
MLFHGGILFPPKVPGTVKRELPFAPGAAIAVKGALFFRGAGLIIVLLGF